MGKRWTVEELIRQQKEKEEKAMEKRGPEYIYVVTDKVAFSDGRRTCWGKRAYHTCEEAFRYLQSIMRTDAGRGAEWTFDFDNKGWACDRVTLVGKGRWYFDEDVLEDGVCTVEIDRINVMKNNGRVKKEYGGNQK